MMRCGIARPTPNASAISLFASAARSLILVIDVQNDFFSQEGAFCAAGGVSTPLEAILPPLSNFLVQSRSLGVRVAFTQHVHDPAALSESAQRLHQLRYGSPGFPVAGSWGARLCPPIQPEPDEPVIVKHQYNAFSAPALAELVATAQIEAIVIVGGLTNVCVESTARVAEERGFAVVVVADCVASNDPELHHASLKNIETYFGWVCTSKEMLDAWGARYFVS